MRVPDHPIARSILEALGEPIVSSTLIMPGKETPETDPTTIRNLLEKQVDLIIDGEHCGFEPTTVIDLMEETPKILRYGKGATDMFEID